MGCDFLELAAPAVASLTPYKPGKPPSELERELGLSDIVMLASNENPLGPSALAMQAVQRVLATSARYPDPNGHSLKQALGQRYGLELSQLTLGNGSNDLLNLVARAFLSPGDEVIYSQYAFAVYALATQVCQATAVVTPARDYGHDLDAMAAAVTERTRIIFLANPNNPSGTAFDDAAFADFMARVPARVIVVLDEAYTEYVEPSAGLPNGLALLSRYANLVVMRTFSKAFGLAGLRVGFAAADPQITDLLNRVREPFNVNAAGLAAAEAVLADDEYLEQTRVVARTGMRQLCEGFERLGLNYIRSFGNFVTVDMGQPAQPLFQALLREGVILRPLDNYGMPNHLRITVGVASENDRCLAALQKVLK